MIVRHEETDRDPVERLTDRILAAALRSIEQLGDDFTFEDVADRAGVSVDEVTAECGNSRTQLVFLAYHLHLWRMVEVLEGAPYADDPDGALSSFIYNLSGLLAISPAFIGAIISDGGWGDELVVVKVCELLDDDRDQHTMEYSLTDVVTALLSNFVCQISAAKNNEAHPTEALLDVLRSLRSLTARGEEEIPQV
ncbi:hypothetical protein AB0911_28790 [Streptomyces nigra]|uniref:hypothetical protein n=1 Tax=Streptomyces nigra TaxID=1827580 RepID=UPI0034538A67